MVPNNKVGFNKPAEGFVPKSPIPCMSSGALRIEPTSRPSYRSVTEVSEQQDRIFEAISPIQWLLEIDGNLSWDWERIVRDVHKGLFRLKLKGSELHCV